jgi:hypothetical protein
MLDTFAVFAVFEIVNIFANPPPVTVCDISIITAVDEFVLVVFKVIRSLVPAAGAHEDLSM